MKQGFLIAGFAILSAAAVAGWTRNWKAAPQTPGYYNPAAYGCEQPVTPAMMPVSYAPAQAYYRQPVAVQRYAPARTRVVHVRHRRPLSHSVAIVAGSAGTAAAIGALAGGGRGAAIGALAGGAGGFIYDRLTHNR